MAYQILFLIGALGFLAQLVLGFTHGGGNHGHNGHAADAHAHTGAGNGVQNATHHAGHTHAVGQAHHAHADSHGAHHHGHDAGQNGEKAHGGISWMAILSPLALFSVALGAGATGLLLKSILLSPWLLAGAAAVGGLAFYNLAVQPLMRLILGFASKPATNLGGVVAQEVEVMGRFDASGRGMVSAEVDGQVVRLLAYLDPDMRKDGLTVVPGERLVVTGVDPQKNTVQVTRL